MEEIRLSTSKGKARCTKYSKLTDSIGYVLPRSKDNRLSKLDETEDEYMEVCKGGFARLSLAKVLGTSGQQAKSMKP